LDIHQQHCHENPSLSRNNTETLLHLNSTLNTSVFSHYIVIELSDRQPASLRPRREGKTNVVNMLIVAMVDEATSYHPGSISSA
jgi:hypothetical protein